MIFRPVLLFLVMLVIAYLLAFVWNRRLPKEAPMGLILAMFLPALGHLYILKMSSVPYILVMVVFGWLTHLFLGNMAAYILTSAVSMWLMYHRIVVRGER
ncbi:hypothetical protein JCM15519_15250 [Fundidesulfovibrio butyratiphilus]